MAAWWSTAPAPTFHVDDIVVMEGGRVVEHGTRADLAGDADTRFHRLLTLALEEVPT